MIDIKEYDRILSAARKRPPRCEDKRPCFARNGKTCTILWSAYDNGECPFCKKERGNDL